MNARRPDQRGVGGRRLTGAVTWGDIRTSSRAPCERVRDAGRSGFHSLIGYVRATFLVDLVDAVGIGTGLAIMGVPLALPLASLVFSVATTIRRHGSRGKWIGSSKKHAPGFTELVVAKSMHRPSDWKPVMPAYRRGQRWQVTALPAVDLRPAPGLGRAETPIEQLYLGSAGATPGGGVHGVCGRNAALAARASDGCARLAAVPAEPGRPSTGNPLRPGIEPRHVAPAILRCFRIPGASWKPPD